MEVFFIRASSGIIWAQIREAHLIILFKKSREPIKWESRLFLKVHLYTMMGCSSSAELESGGGEKLPTDGGFLYLFAHLVVFFFCEKNIDIGILIDQALGYI